MGKVSKFEKEKIEIKIENKKSEKEENNERIDDDNDA